MRIADYGPPQPGSPAAPDRAELAAHGRARHRCRGRLLSGSTLMPLDPRLRPFLGGARRTDIAARSSPLARLSGTARIRQWRHAVWLPSDQGDRCAISRRRRSLADARAFSAFRTLPCH